MSWSVTLKTCPLYGQLRATIAASTLTVATSLAYAQPQQTPQPVPSGGYTIRSPLPFGAEEAVNLQVLSATANAKQLTLQLAGSAEPLAISPWPAANTRTGTPRGGHLLGLALQRMPRSGARMVAVQTLQPFGPAQRLSVQHGAQLPSLVVQTRGQSGQEVVAGWRTVLAGDRWVLQNDAAKTALDATRTQRIRSAGRSLCVYPSARPAGPEGQESPPLIDWVLIAATRKNRC